MINGSFGAPGDLKYNYAAIRVLNYLYIYLETYSPEELCCHFDWIVKGGTADNFAWLGIANPQHKMSAALVRNRNAILEELAVIELGPGCLELKMLMF